MASEITRILECYQQRKNFLLQGGAGCGKTYSLVKSLELIIKEDPKSQIACITYTNVGVEEIRQRIPHVNVTVSTIHDFLWDFISQYQKDLRTLLHRMIKNQEIRSKNFETFEFDDDLDKIVYREWRSLRKGVISHDDVILLSSRIFSESKKLCDFFKDRYDVIFVDEYQDTFDGVLDILTIHLEKSSKLNFIGFFGDPMQSIFRQTENKLDVLVSEGKIEKIVKNNNRRSPKEIVECINNIRTDGISQVIVNDIDCPNYQVIGNVTFMYGDNENYDIDEIKKNAVFNEFDYSNSDENKELYLVHNLIALKLGFEKLIDIYGSEKIVKFKEKVKKKVLDSGFVVNEGSSFHDVVIALQVEPTTGQKEYIDSNQDSYDYFKSLNYNDVAKIYLDKDQLIGERKTHTKGLPRGSRRDKLISHLFHIQECVYYYTKNDFGSFIEKSNFKIHRHQNKIILKNNMDKFLMDSITIEKAIELADESGIWPRDEQLDEFLNKNDYLLYRVKDIPFKEIKNLFNYVEDFTHYSTQHNIKGAEFDNVFVVLDNGKWNQYNFNYLFEGREDKESVVRRTRNLFYVCCSRAKKNLVVYFDRPTSDALDTAKDWFGEQNIIKV